MYYFYNNMKVKCKLNLFTNYNCGFLLFNIYHKNNLNMLYATNCITTWIIFYTFHCAIILDNKAFEKIRLKNNYSFSTFHLGNFILHIIPYLYVLQYPAKNINIYHALYGILLKFLWLYFSTNGTMDFGNIYIHFSKKNIIKLYIISTSTALIVPFYYSNNISKTLLLI